MRPALVLVTAASLALGVTTASAQPADLSRQHAFDSAAAEFGVPVSVLLGVSYLESRWDANAGTPSTSAGYGPMHLTDVTAANAGGMHHDDGTEDPRGDDARPALTPKAAPPVAQLPSLQTVDVASSLIGVPAATLRSETKQNIRGGAALLAKYQKEIGVTSANPGDWYGAVARYGGASDTGSASTFADEVFTTMAQGVERVTDDGQHVKLDATPVQANRGQLAQLGLRQSTSDETECPRTLACEWIPAPYQQLPNNGYGNHDKGDRPESQKIKYIVIHDTEGYWKDVIGMVQDPTYVSWQYSLRSADGYVAQHVKAKDVAWQAGNWYVNSTSIGLEHEGFAKLGTWYTEAMYRSSAKLVRYLAAKYQIPLDRAHIIGHDNVPGTVPATVRGMHWDPGPYWDWSHYFDLLGAPFRPTGSPAMTGMVTIKPDYASNKPAFTDCVTAGQPCTLRGSGSVILRTEPRADAPLLKDAGLRPDGSPGTMQVSDHSSRVETGQQYAVAEVRGEWTAIWYLGQKGWFHNPRKAPTALGAIGVVVTPKKGKATVPVYGRAYPEASAYPANIPVQAVTPLQYTFSAGERYALGGVNQSEYYSATTFDTANHTVVRGKTKYLQIQFGHRVMFVNADDVDVLPSFWPQGR
ncbi:N-acetyl-anhydromuramyl-L-alanine amidase AmpD [Kibdelosporangium banguiense]|uniref:N-acetylmuramoyl-L-alanine amidase n=1 Tax=Kibdelosporangium banguiense TaxID=1365924 RepID=A0ABS4TDP7_9PSEU|nr:N-acetylmuramoyl-L-alanine amidase [Kibdelosporangium banguiense]MBP2322540.1 N-acetyl-anhydromuramyl-L-alanine amidase AmpD [Kibdelosporangium banguiense]